MFPRALIPRSVSRCRYTAITVVAVGLLLPMLASHAGKGGSFGAVTAIASTCTRITEGFGGFDGVLRADDTFGGAIAVIGTTSTGNTLMAAGAPFTDGGCRVCDDPNLARWGRVWIMTLDDSCTVVDERAVGPICEPEKQNDNAHFGWSLAHLGRTQIDGNDLIVVASGSPGYEPLTSAAAATRSAG